MGRKFCKPACCQLAVTVITEGGKNECAHNQQVHPGKEHFKGGHQRVGKINIDKDEQEQPHHVHEMPIPCGKFKSQVLGWGEMVLVGAHQAHGEENGAYNHVETVEAGSHIERGGIHAIGKTK